MFVMDQSFSRNKRVKVATAEKICNEPVFRIDGTSKLF
jgi:hypothetical protein